MEPISSTTSGGSAPAGRADPASDRRTVAAASSDPPLDPGDDAAPGTPGTGENLCPRCNGSGRDGEGDCPECGGSGKVISGIGGG